MQKPLKTKSTSFETRFLKRWQKLPAKGKHLKVFFYRLYEHEQKLLKNIKDNKNTKRALTKDTIQNLINTLLQEKDAFIQSLQNDFSKSHLDASLEFLLCLNQLKRHYNTLSTQLHTPKGDLKIFTLNDTLPLLSSLDLILINAKKGNASLFILPTQFKAFYTCLKKLLDTHLVSETFSYLQATKPEDLLYLDSYQQHRTSKKPHYSATNYCILDRNTAFDKTVLPLLSSRLFLSGQHYLSAQVLFVHQSQLNTIMIQAKQVLSQAFGPSLYDYIDSDDLSRFPNKAHFQAQVHHYKMAKYLGAKCFFGDYFDEINLLFQPGILYSDDSDCFCPQEPFFAPILQLVSYKNINDVFKSLKDIPPSFIASCYSTNKSTQNRFVKSSQSLCKQLNSWPCPYLNQETYDEHMTRLLYANSDDSLLNKKIKTAKAPLLCFNFEHIKAHLNKQISSFKL